MCGLVFAMTSQWCSTCHANVMLNTIAPGCSHVLTCATTCLHKWVGSAMSFLHGYQYKFVGYLLLTCLTSHRMATALGHYRLTVNKRLLQACHVLSCLFYVYMSVGDVCSTTHQVTPQRQGCQHQRQPYCQWQNHSLSGHQAAPLTAAGTGRKGGREGEAVCNACSPSLVNYNLNHLCPCDYLFPHTHTHE